MSASPARAAAFDALRRVERDAAFATDALDPALARLARREDAALATELVMGVLRWRRLLDFLAERFTKRPVDSLDLEVLIALRLGLYQLRFLTRVPASAAVNESVELTKRARKRSATGLVNAALRRAAGVPEVRGPLEALLPADLSDAGRLGILHSHPTWLVERWLARFGAPGTQALLEANNRAPRLTGAVLDPAKREEVAHSLAAGGFDPVQAVWLASAVILRAVPAGGIAVAHAIRDGSMLIQDEASQMIPFLLDVQPGHRVLDLCAAPGGKTARLAWQAGQGAEGTVLAGDVHAHRLREMRALLNRLGARGVHAVVLDATGTLPLSQTFDRILVDAPCSGTGTLARNPEIRWRLEPADIAALADKQRTILQQAIRQLAPGGRLVYSTCSLEAEENEQVVQAILAATPGATFVNAEPALAPHLLSGAEAAQFFDDRGFFRAHPWRHATDGFFAAVVSVS